MLDAMMPISGRGNAKVDLRGDERDPSEGEIGPDLVFATQDRYITAAALPDDEWAGMCRALNRQDLIDVIPDQHCGCAIPTMQWSAADHGCRAGEVDRK